MLAFVISVSLFIFYLYTYVANVECYRVEQELMARIVCEMHERQCQISAVQSQLNPSQRLSDHASKASSLASVSEDLVIGLCRANEPSSEK